MSQHDQLVDLVEDLYAAPGTREGWLVFLDRLCSALNGSGANFISLTPGKPHANVATSVRTDPQALELYRDHWGALDPWARSPRLPTVRASTAVLGDELIAHSALKQTAFYCDFGRSYDIARCVAGMVENGPQGVSVISINGTERRGSFATEEAVLLTALMPHVQRSLQLHRRLVTSESLADTLADAADVTPHAVLLVNAAGQVVFMNAAATHLVAQREGLTIDAGELRAARSHDTDRLRLLIAQASATSRGEDWRAGGTLALGRPSGRRPLVAVVSPVSRRRLHVPGAEMAAAMLIVTDTEKGHVPNEELLRSLFSLTPAEARLTRLLAEGMSLAVAAVHLGLSVETVRTRMKTIFEKTETHGQTDLVRLVLSATPPEAPARLRPI